MKTKLIALAFVVAAGMPVAFGAPEADEPVLQGPKVVDGGVPGTRRPFGDGQGGDNKQRLADRPMPQMEFMRAVNALRAESTPESARLTDEQQAKIKEINQEFEKSMRAFREEHKAEFEDMRGQFGDRGRPPRGPKPDGEAMMPPPDGGAKPEGGKGPDGAARQRFEELRAQAPSPKDAQAKIFSVLTDEQKPIVTQKLDSIRQEMAERGLENKAREEVRRKLAKQDGEKGGPPGGPDGGPRRFDPQNLPPQVKERLANMTPEEREQAIQKMKERAQNRPQGGPDGRRQRMKEQVDSLPPDLKETWESMTPEERRFLIQKLRERAIENGEEMPPPRRRARPAPDEPKGN